MNSYQALSHFPSNGFPMFAFQIIEKVHRFETLKPGDKVVCKYWHPHNSQISAAAANSEWFIVMELSLNGIYAERQLSKESYFKCCHRRGAVHSFRCGNSIIRMPLWFIIEPQINILFNLRHIVSTCAQPIARTMCSSAVQLPTHDS